MNNVSFSDNELKIARAWLERKSNSEIAMELGKSESYVSQTLKRIKDKIYTLENSILLLEELQIIEPVSPIKLTEGRKAFVPNRNIDDRTILKPLTEIENQLKNITGTLGKMQVLHSEEINFMNKGSGSSEFSRDFKTTPSGAEKIGLPYK